MAPIDSAHQAQALRFILAHVFRAQDPLLRAVIGPALPDTTLVLFETVAPGWTVEPWQTAQESLLHELTDRLSRVATQSKTTHMLPVACAELATLNEAITQAGKNTASASMRTYTERLLQPLEPILDPMLGMCSPDNLKGTPASGGTP